MSESDEKTEAPSTETQGEVERLEILQVKAKNLTQVFAINYLWWKSEKMEELVWILFHQQWVSLFDTHARLPIYLVAINEFCANFVCEKAMILSVVNGTPISFDAEYVSNLFRVPNEGFEECVKGKMTMIINDVNSSQIVANIRGDYEESSITNHNLLSTLQKRLF